MNYRSKHYLKAFGAVLILLTLLAGLFSCASEAQQVAGPSDISSAPSETGETPPSTAEPAPSASDPSAPYTDEQINALYTANGLSVLELRHAGAYTIVHYYSPEVPYGKVSRFDWFDRETGDRAFVCGSIYADKFEITADKTLTVLTTGLPTFDGYQQFPKILTFAYVDVDGAKSVTSIDSDYYMPLERSFTLGLDQSGYLESVCYDGSSMLLKFNERPGYAQELHTDVESVPKITVTNADGVSSVTIFNTVLADNFIQTAGKLLGSDPSPVTVTCDGKDTVVTFKMHENASRYSISCFTTPVERVPHAVITYEANSFGYPKGW